jgi:hypothetical protein
MLLHLVELLGLMFVAGVITSYAEYKFQYSLYLAIASFLGKEF